MTRLPLRIYRAIGFLTVAAAICAPLAAHAQVAAGEKERTPPSPFTLTVGFPRKETSVDRLTLTIKLTNRSGRPATVDGSLSIAGPVDCTATDANGSSVDPFNWTGGHLIVSAAPVTLRPGASARTRLGWRESFRDLSGERNPIKVVFTYDSNVDEDEAESDYWGVQFTKINVSAQPVYLRFVNGRVKVLSEKEMAGSAAKGK